MPNNYVSEISYFAATSLTLLGTLLGRPVYFVVCLSETDLKHDRVICISVSDFRIGSGVGTIN